MTVLVTHFLEMMEPLNSIKPSNEFKRKSFTSATLFEPQPAGYATSPRVNKMVAKDWSEPQIVNTEQQMHWRQQIVCK